MFDQFKSYTPGFAFVVCLALLGSFLTPIAGMKRFQNKDGQETFEAGVTNPALEE